MTHTQIVQKLSQIVSDLQFQHWNSKIGYHHLALGETYKSLSAFLDVVAETLIGKYGPLKPFEIPPTSTETSKLPDSIQEFSLLLREYATEYKCYDLINLSDEILSASSKLKYLLQQS